MNRSICSKNISFVLSVRAVVAAAAYRSGSIITNDYDGVVHDYRRKRGIIDKRIFLPAHVPREYYDRATLWNAVEKIEKTKNAQLAREIEIAIPKEISLVGTYQMVKEFETENFVSEGMIADCCYHDKGDGNRQIKEKNIFIKSLAQKITNLTEEARRIAYEVKEKLEQEVYELREQLLQSKLDVELLLETDLKKRLKISKMCEQLSPTLEKQYEQLNKEKRELRAVYDTKVEVVPMEDMEELMAERRVVRDDETKRARVELLVKYGEAFKDRIFEKAVEKVDCELEGKAYKEKKLEKVDNKKETKR